MIDVERLYARLLETEFDYKITTKLDDTAKKRLKEHIQNSILERYDYKPLEHIQDMVDESMEVLEYDLLAINDIQSINYSIKDEFFTKLQEPYTNSDDLDFEDYEDNLDVPLNEYTLTDWIKFEIIDGVDLVMDNLEEKIEAAPSNLFKEFFKEMTEGLFDNVREINSEPLTKRANNLIRLYSLKMTIGTNIALYQQIFNIKNNSPKVSQEILNNSYDAIIDALKKFPDTENIIDTLNREKSINSDLFTNAKKLAKVKSNSHFMSFLYKCDSVFDKNGLIVFKDFVEGLISGYMQYLEFKDSDKKLKEYKQDLEVLKRYNDNKENDKNIQDLEEKINFLSISRNHQKFIPFKELSNRLEINVSQISNYMTNIASNSTHKSTIKKHFDELPTISKKICIGQYDQKIIQKLTPTKDT